MWAPGGGGAGVGGTFDPRAAPADGTETGACPDCPGRAIGATPTIVPLSLLDIIGIDGPPGAGGR